MANKKVLEIVVKDKATPAVKKIDKSLKNTGKQAKKTGEEMNSAIGNVSPRIGGLINQVKSIGTSFKALAVGGAVGAIAGLGSLFVMATKKGAEFAKQMSTLKAVSGATSSEMDALANSAKNLGSSTQFTAIEVGELQTEFAKMGFTTKQILASTKATLDLAASMEVGLAEAATLAGSTVNAFGLEAKDTQRVVDVLAASTSESALDFSSLTEAFKNVAPAAAATNVSVEETSALLAVLANNGIKGSRAGTGLSKAFIDLNKKGIPLNEALDKIKNSSNSLNTAMDLAGEVGGKALSVLASKRPQIEALTKSFENSAGAAKRMAETRLDNLAGDTTKLSSAWEGFLLSIEDGEGLFSSIARGIVQATTDLLGFITPSQDLADTYFQQVEAVNTLESSMTPLLTRYDELATKTDLSNIEQEELDGLILKIAADIPQAVTQFDEYGKALGISTEAAKKFIKESKDILKIQNREAIEEQQDAIEDLNDKLKIYGNALEKRNGQFVREFRTYSKLGKETINYIALTGKEITERSKRKQAIEEEINARTQIIAKLKGEKTAAELALEASENSGKGKEEETIVIRDLIKEQEDLLELYNKMPQATRAELAEKNILIAGVNAQIKMLKSLGIEQKKVVKQKKALIDEEIIAEEKRQKRIIEINESLNKKIETDAAKTSIEKIQLAKKRALEELNQLNATEKQKAATILFWDGKIEEAKEKTQQDELIKEEQQFQMLQKLQNTAQEQELLELAQQYDAKILLAEGNAELILALKEQQKIDEAAIDKDFIQKKADIESNAAERDRQEKLRAVNVNLQIAANGLNAIQSLGDAAFAHRTKNLKEGSKEQLKAAKKQFNFNKALQLGMAVIDGGKAITASLAQSPLAIGPIPNPAGIASLAFASLTSAAQIAMIASQKYEAPKKNITDVSPPSIGGGGANTSPTNAPNFNVVGQSGFNQVASALGTQQPVQAYVVAGNVTTAQQLANNTIQTATF